MGLTKSLAQKRDPSLRTCQRSASARLSVWAFFQFPLGRTATTVLGCEEAGTILAEDFLFFVAEDALGILVPSGHTPWASTIKIA